MRKFIIPAPSVQKVPGITPDKIRQAKSKLALLQAGGKRVSVNLTGQAVADLAAIRHRDGSDNTGAILAALAAFALR